ncbi:MAG TPA: hypothetical protein VGL72_33565, partial [Bryobacteraceae bacterium]
QTDNWVAPSAPCLAAFCRTAGFARAELVGNLQYSASFACYRQWNPPQQSWGLAPRLIDAGHHLDFGLNFNSRRDEYIVAWFSVDSSHLGINDVFPEVSGFGVRPIHVGKQGPNWMATFRLPPGLERGWHEVRVRARGSRLSDPLRIAVDIPMESNEIRIATLADGATWKAGEIDLNQGSTLALWVAGLPESADRMSLRAKVDGQPVEVRYVEAESGKETRQVNIIMPQDGNGESSVEVAMGNARAEGTVRRIGLV